MIKKINVKGVVYDVRDEKTAAELEARNGVMVNYNQWKGVENSLFSLTEILGDEDFVSLVRRGTVLTFLAAEGKWARYQYAGAENDAAIVTASNWRNISGATYGISQTADATKVQISSKGENGGVKDILNISAATTEKAGVMTAEDKQKLDTVAEKMNNLKYAALPVISWTSETTPDLNKYTTHGVWRLGGIRYSNGDNLPINSVGENASISGILTVTLAEEGETSYMHAITQHLILGNTLGKESKVYVRTGCRTSYNNGATYETTWSGWQVLQAMTEVGVVASLDDFIDNGMYSGVFTGNGPELFVMVVLNDYAVAESAAVTRSVAQFKLAVATGLGTAGISKRVGSGETISWGEWENIG